MPEQSGKSLEVRLTELENAVNGLTEAANKMQQAQASFIGQQCYICHQGYICHQCYTCQHCYTCIPCWGCYTCHTCTECIQSTTSGASKEK